MAQFNFVKSCESKEGRDSIEDFMLSAIENRCEGLMIKVPFFNPSTSGLSKLHYIFADFG